MFDESAADDIHGNVRLQATYFAQGWANDIPTGMKQFVADLTIQAQLYSGQDRRRVPRLDQSSVFSVAPVNALYTPVGESFSMMTRNISRTGLALVHTRAVDGDFVAVAMSPEMTRPTQFIARVKWCRPVRQFYEVGCEIVVRLVS